MGEVPTWDLDSLCPGGAAGHVFEARRSDLEARVAALEQQAAKLRGLDTDADAWASWVMSSDEVGEALHDLGSLAVCEASADSRSSAARSAEAATDALQATLDEASVALEAAVGAADQATFDAFVARESMAPSSDLLRHTRAGQALRLDPARQALWVAVEREALYGWGRLYDRTSGSISGELEVDGTSRTVGVAELGALRSHEDEAMRRAAFEAGGRAWSSASALCATCLTHLTGARQTYQDRIGTDELAQTLHANRCSRATMNALWEACDTLRPSLARYLERKATVLGKTKLDWWDLDAPLPAPDAPTGVPFADMGKLVVDAFDSFHPDLAAFARRSLEQRWVEAEPRDGKRPGGFCTDFPLTRQSRIFMTYTGSLDNGTTLAHELGHAWHNEVVFPEPVSRRNLTSGLAETASTFAEAVFRDALLEGAGDRATHAFMLDADLSAAVAFLMNIPTRFDFERRLFTLRRQGPLDPEQLSSEMEALQRRHYADSLNSYNPLFWASKLHFYIPEFGFYNWPYTFGYLFSAAVYHRAKTEGPSFMGTLTELLRRTGWQDAESIGRDVLGVDMTDPAFWIEAATPIHARVDAFLEATD